jgi:hypothetical protein
MDDRPGLVGDVLDFRGILFAPVTPEGVKDLLLTLLPDLQMRDVTYWPDGMGSVQRRVGEAWQRLQVVFAVHSQEVKGHVAAAGPIDLVICYVDDWGDCPVEVLPLKPRTMTEASGRPEASRVLQTSPTCCQPSGSLSISTRISPGARPPHATSFSASTRLSVPCPRKSGPRSRTGSGSKAGCPTPLQSVSFSLSRSKSSMVWG